MSKAWPGSICLFLQVERRQSGEMAGVCPTPPATGFKEKTLTSSRGHIYIPELDSFLIHTLHLCVHSHEYVTHTPVRVRRCQMFPSTMLHCLFVHVYPFLCAALAILVLPAWSWTQWSACLSLPLECWDQRHGSPTPLASILFFKKMLSSCMHFFYKWHNITLLYGCNNSIVHIKGIFLIDSCLLNTWVCPITVFPLTRALQVFLSPFCKQHLTFGCRLFKN